MRTAILLLILATPTFAQSWSVQTSGLDTSLRGIAVSRASSPSTPVIWACGSHGVILRSGDGGKTWTRIHVPNGDSLDFRSIQAFGSSTAYAMSIGSGQASRIYKTTDAGRHWSREYTASKPAIFLDDLVCQSQVDCYTVSDPVDGNFLVLRSYDGKSWHELPRDTMPAALPGEGVFAASGTSLAFASDTLYFVTGGAAKARVFRSADHGRTWSVSAAPISAGNASSGIFSIARRGNIVVIVGGDYKNATEAVNSAAYSLDGGATWSLTASGLHGFRSAVAFIDNSTLIAAGPSGEDISRDGGAHWTTAGSLNLNAVAVFNSQVWAVGPKGTVARMDWPSASTSR